MRNLTEGGASAGHVVHTSKAVKYRTKKHINSLGYNVTFLSQHTKVGTTASRSGKGPGWAADRRDLQGDGGVQGVFARVRSQDGAKVGAGHKLLSVLRT